MVAMLFSMFIVTAMIIKPALFVAPPGIPEISSPQKIILGETVTLSCNVSGGDPTPSVVWFRDNRPIDNSSTTSGGITVNTYTFTATHAEHLEVFECQTDNKITQNPLSRTKFVEVYVAPHVPTLTGPTVLVSESPGTWKCTSILGYPPPTMTIRIGNTAFTNEVTYNTNYDANSKSYTVTGTLSWAPTSSINGQTLYCDVFHPETSTTNIPRTVGLPLTINAAFGVFAPGTYYKPMVGSTVVINCIVTSGTATQIQWYNDERIIISANPRFSGGSVSNPSLTISQVQESDGGIYVCQASDGTRTLNTSAITVAPIAPLVVLAPLTSYSPVIEENVALTCVITSGTATQISWFKDNNVLDISANSRFSGSTVSSPTLTISNVQQSDQGVYVCEAFDGSTRTRSSAITLSPSEKMVVIDDVMHDFLQNYNKYSRPATTDVPTVHITHYVSLVRIQEFDDTTLVLYALQGMFWKDPRLTWTGEPKKISLPSSVVWTPDIAPLNEKIHKAFEPKVLVSQDGSVRWVLSGNLTSSRCAIKTGELTECIFKFLSWTYDVDMVDLSFPADGVLPSVDLSNFENHPEYEIVSTCAIRNVKEYPCCGEIHPELQYTVVVKRRAKIYTDNVTCLGTGR